MLNFTDLQAKAIHLPDALRQQSTSWRSAYGLFSCFNYLTNDDVLKDATLIQKVAQSLDLYRVSNEELKCQILIGVYFYILSKDFSSIMSYPGHMQLLTLLRTHLEALNYPLLDDQHFKEKCIERLQGFYRWVASNYYENALLHRLMDDTPLGLLNFSVTPTPAAANSEWFEGAIKRVT